MKVSELIFKLGGFNPDAEVLLEEYSDPSHTWMYYPPTPKVATPRNGDPIFILLDLGTAADIAQYRNRDYDVPPESPTEVFILESEE